MQKGFAKKLDNILTQFQHIDNIDVIMWQCATNSNSVALYIL